MLLSLERDTRNSQQSLSWETEVSVRGAFFFAIYSFCATWSTFHMRDLRSQNLNKFFRCSNCLQNQIGSRSDWNGLEVKSKGALGTLLSWSAQVHTKWQLSLKPAQLCLWGKEPVCPDLTSPEKPNSYLMTTFPKLKVLVMMLFCSKQNKTVCLWNKHIWGQCLLLVSGLRLVHKVFFFFGFKKLLCLGHTHKHCRYFSACANGLFKVGTGDCKWWRTMASGAQSWLHTSHYGKCKVPWPSVSLDADLRPASAALKMAGRWLALPQGHKTWTVIPRLGWVLRSFQFQRGSWEKPNLTHPDLIRWIHTSLFQHTSSMY